MQNTDLRIITDAMPAAAVHCDREQRYLWVNAQYERWVGRPGEAIIGRTLSDILGAAQVREVQGYIERVLAGDQVQYERLADLRGLGRRWIGVTMRPTVGASGRPDGWVGIIIDIHDRKHAEQALREADARKDEFLAALAHELRNPLAPMRNAVAILGRKGPLDPEVAWSQGVLERQIDQLSRLIDDLLDIERIARGRLVLRKERVPLEVIVDMALESSRPQVTAAGHHLSVLLPSERVALDADPARLAQALSTLIKDAAQHTSERGSISLGAAIEGRTVLVSVEDEGGAIDPDIAGRLSRPGLALKLVQGIVALHGGSVEAKSAAGGTGTELVVRLPLPASAALAEPKPAPYAERAAPTLRVLVADDNRDAADSMQRILALFGHEVRVAYDGDAALELGERFRPRVALLDIGMPGTNGYDVARVLRRRQGDGVTLVAITGWGQDADRRRSSEAGFDHHLTKPVDPRTLNELLAEVASR